MAIRVRSTQGKRTEKSLLGRRLNTIDAVILVAAIAVGIAVGRTYYLRSMEVHLTRNSSKLALVAHGNAGVWVADVVGSASPFLLSATLAILILRLRPWPWAASRFPATGKHRLRGGHACVRRLPCSHSVVLRLTVCDI